MKVKICGITNSEDARAAISAGADALGFNFYERSARYISPDAARGMIEETCAESSVLRVGVFVNAKSDNVARIVEIANLNCVQLHGDEPPEFCRELKTKIDALIVKAFRVRAGLTLEEMASYEVDAVLLDAYSPVAYGGTGARCDWDFARRAARKFPRLYLAGGLTPENVADAIRAVKPFGVDAASGVEASPGRKDFERVRRFVAAARGTRNLNRAPF